MMFRALSQFVAVLGLAIALCAGMWWWSHRTREQQELERLSAHTQQLTARTKQLETYVERLSADRRVADVLVLGTSKDPAGRTHRTLLFVEYDRNDKTLPPKRFEVIGENTHIDAMVIQFERGYIAEGDALRGRSVALFTRIFGDEQPASTAERIDEPSKIPLLYRGTDPALARFEAELWADFWKFAEDPKLAASKGVSVAHGQSVWGPLSEDKLYTIALPSVGGLTMKSQPMPGIYREALKRSVDAGLTASVK
jgi:hypothetical protein